MTPTDTAGNPNPGPPALCTWCMGPTDTAGVCLSGCESPTFHIVVGEPLPAGPPHCSGCGVVLNCTGENAEHEAAAQARVKELETRRAAVEVACKKAADRAGLRGEFLRIEQTIFTLAEAVVYERLQAGRAEARVKQLEVEVARRDAIIVDRQERGNEYRALAEDLGFKKEQAESRVKELESALGRAAARATPCVCGEER